MKFNTQPKPKSEEPLVVEVKARTVTTTQVRTDSPLLIEELMDLLSHGSVFAEHCSLMHGVRGLEGIIILKSILKTAELDPDTSLIDRILHEMQEAEADAVQVLLIDFPDAVRKSIDVTIKAYFNSASNDYNPTPTDIADAMKSAGKVGSIDELISAIEATLFKGKK